mmetsp:Transcript_10419/g.18745  ORF Transcript_10419/g.18745 Transcript_10419/m.18745 type:complete len:304 (-) Transcript_10419:67-978(-)
MPPGEGKMKGQSQSRWVAAAALVLAGLAAVVYKQHKDKRPVRMVPPPVDHILHMMEHEESEGLHDSLEDVFARLEGKPTRPSPQASSGAAHAPPEEETELDELLEETIKQLEEEAEVQDKHHQDFADLVKKEMELKLDFNLTSMKQEYLELFSAEAPQLLCQGCRLVAGRLTSELKHHDVNGQEYPVLLFQQKRRAMDATCNSFKYLHPVRVEGAWRFEARDQVGSEAKDDSLSQRLCNALLEEVKFDLLTKLIEKKVPSYSLFHSQPAAPVNLERFICAQRTKVCKRSQVREDDEEENGDEL